MKHSSKLLLIIKHFLKTTKKCKKLHFSVVYFSNHTKYWGTILLNTEKLFFFFLNKTHYYVFITKLMHFCFTKYLKHRYIIIHINITINVQKQK